MGQFGSSFLNCTAEQQTELCQQTFGVLAPGRCRRPEAGQRLAVARRQPRGDLRRVGCPSGAAGEGTGRAEPEAVGHFSRLLTVV